MSAREAPLCRADALLLQPNWAEGDQTTAPQFPTKHSPLGCRQQVTLKFPRKNKEEISAAGQQQGLKLKCPTPTAKEGHGFLPSQALCPDGAMGRREAVNEPSSWASWCPEQGIDSSGRKSPHLAQAAE